MRPLVYVLVGISLMASSPGLAQPLSFGQIEGPAVVTLSQERLFTESLFGQRVQAEIEAASTALARENREIEAALLEEELQLTAQRAEMTAEEFRPLGDEFDTRVEAIRSEQGARLLRLNAQAEAARRFFIQTTTPILVALLQERGAAAVLDSRAVIYSVDGIDITDLALERIDAELGDGGEGPIFDQLGTPAEPDAP
jgi:Skp family chaperone for outer membrane proteins